MQRFNGFLLAVTVSLLVIVAGLFHALKQHSPYAPQVNSEQQANTALKGEEHAKAGEQNAAKPNEEHGGKNAQQREEEGTEFWPSFLGLRLKITDSLIAAFTFGLLVFNGLLWRSTEKLWGLTKEALVAEQRAWVILKELRIESFKFGELKDGAADARADVYIRMENVGRTPALNVGVRMALIGNWPMEDSAVQEFAQKGVLGGRMVSADEVVEENEVLFVAGGELYRYGQSGRIRPLIVGCIMYQILQDKEIRRTAFVYRPEKTDGGAGYIYVQEGDLTANDVQALVGSGGFVT
jgi:hypothetical protein